MCAVSDNESVMRRNATLRLKLPHVELLHHHVTGHTHNLKVATTPDLGLGVSEAGADDGTGRDGFPECQKLPQILVDCVCSPIEQWDI
mmetsp:Transcript_37306/g.93642  ORF Transcript_37306/g.93642 Transcript_37306/m.93642 type:complete len:88 (-) Transcript_37306:407-670(-)